MKSMHKGLVASLVLAAAGLTVWSAAAGRLRESAPEEQTPTGVATPSPALAPGEAPAVADGAASGAVDIPAEEAPAAVSEGEPVATPPDLKVTVRVTRAGRVLRVQRQGHLIAVRRGAERRNGMHEVSWPLEGDSDGGFVWESTGAKTLETLRGRLELGGDGDFAVENTIRASVVSEDVQRFHRCNGHADGEGGFLVVCRVRGAAAAASVDGSDPGQGVWSQAGETTLVRLDLPMSGEGASARVLGYEKGGKGVLVRAEASRAPGEAAAVLALGSDGRSQPQPVRIHRCMFGIERFRDSL